jgi:rubrerythrin
MTPGACLESAARLELQARDLYRTLALRYVERTDLHDLFSALAEEEALHAQRLVNLAGRPLRAGWDDSRQVHIAGQMAAMEAEAVAMVVRSSGRKPDHPHHILRWVVDFERRFSLVHAEELAPLFAPEARDLFLFLATEDERHRALLDEARRTS